MEGERRRLCGLIGRGGMVSTWSNHSVCGGGRVVVRRKCGRIGRGGLIEPLRLERGQGERELGCWEGW